MSKILFTLAGVPLDGVALGFSLSNLYNGNCISGVMVSMLASSAGDHGFEPLSGQTKDYKICMYCFPV